MLVKYQHLSKMLLLDRDLWKQILIFNHHSWTYGKVVTWSTQHNIEVHSVDTNGGVILDSQINVFLDTKPKVSCVWEVVLFQFIFPDLQKKMQEMIDGRSLHKSL